MRKIDKRVVLLFGLISLLNANSTNTNISQISNFYYKQGFTQGYKNGYEKGYQEGLKFAKEKLNEYLLKIKSYEAGKYLIKTKRITYPQVFYIKMPDNSIKIVIKNSKIENEIRPEDILYIPKLDIKTFNNIKNPNQFQKFVSNAVSLKETTTNIEIPKPSSSELNSFYIFMPNTETYKRILNKAGVPYAEDGNRLKVVFSSKEEANEFIKNFGLNKNIDYFLK